MVARYEIAITSAIEEGNFYKAELLIVSLNNYFNSFEDEK